MVQPEPAHVTARPTTQTMTSTVQPEPAHVTARPTTQTMTSTVQPEPAHVTARPTTQTITSTVQPEPAHVTAWSTTHTITSMVQPEPAHVTARSTLLKMLKTVKAPTKALNVPDTDDDLFDEAGTTGFFAWAVLTTIALILLIVKKLVLQRCDLKCCTQPLPSPPQPQTIEPFEDRIPMNPIMHTPPSQASTPDTPSTVMSTPDTPSTVMSTPDTPSTVTSSAPLVSQHEPVSANTRSKKKLF
ncbi:uncharacterized protein LOC133179968 [Saccostrea echinata]|uniref:uncharacterized protein LOC133179968 n=1 Tax=Saccostrea echinata TaxID=191078 RepID=UPI002A82D947|nr:uncharacterized protein LOC133179968 [Saccostrea echinata]